VSENFTFFNPKVGANYKIDANKNVYLFAGIANREPNRSDFTDQPLNTPKKDANKAERLYNIELGTEIKYSKLLISTNLFGMYYQDQLVATGQLNDVGSPLRQNVDESYRAGIEIQAGYKLTEELTWNIAATFSENKILNYTESLYNYDENFELDNIFEIEVENSDIALSPSTILSSEISYRPKKAIEIALLSRYVGKQYLDNTNFIGRSIDAYFVNDLRFQAIIPQKLFKEVSIQLLVNNVLNEDYASNGYTYSYVFEEKTTENFYYPQSFRNYLIGLNLKF
jgi:iron complex outermembrane receptor protein